MVHEISDKRKKLLGWLDFALAALDPQALVQQRMTDWPARPFALLAIGKAAERMVAGARIATGSGIARGLVVSPADLPSLPQGWKAVRGAHPVPDENSLRAGDTIARWLRELPEGMSLVVLLSGGTSALAELPVEGVSLHDLQAINRWLLGSGFDIRKMNAIRSRFSHLKRGGLLNLVGDRPVTMFAISDVPGDRFEDIGSGPLSPVPILWPSDDRIPDWLARLHAEAMMPAPVSERLSAQLECLATNRDMMRQVESAAAVSGIAVLERGVLTGDAADAGRVIAERVRSGPPGIRLFGGETTVTLPVSGAKRGGRNQHLALAAARELAGAENVMLLAFATDGVDGNSQDAGGLVDGGTFLRITESGLDVDACLLSADSGAALAAAGDLVHTGPTGTNMMDIVVGWKVA